MMATLLVAIGLTVSGGAVEAEAASGKSARRDAATTEAASTPGREAASGAVETLQLGLFATRGDAEWAWLSIRRQLPAVAKSLTITIDAAPSGGGIVLRAAVATDGAGVCRQLLRERFSCFVVRDAAAPAQPRTPLPAVKPIRQPRGAEAEMVARAEPVTPTDDASGPAYRTAAGPSIASPSDTIPREKPEEPGAAERIAAAAAGTTPSEKAAPEKAAPERAGAAGTMAGTMTVTKPMDAPSAETAGAGSAAGDRTEIAGSVAQPVVSAPASPPVPPTPPHPAALRGGGLLTARTLDGFIRYSTDDAKVLAEIERRTRRRGRIGAVLPSGGLEVTPAILTQPEFNICALTFDDGPHRTVTRRILEILAEEKVIATYFPVGNVAVRYPDLIRDWVAAGHEIGNHSYTHGDLRAMKPETQRFEIAETNRVLRELGATSILFRPPYGRYNHSLLDMAREEGSETVLWNVDTRDWKVRDPDKIVQHVTTAAGSGSVLLLHSTYPTTAAALPRVIQSLRAKNCEFVTLSDWIARMRAAGELPVTNAALPMPRVAHARN